MGRNQTEGIVVSTRVTDRYFAAFPAEPESQGLREYRELAEVLGESICRITVEVPTFENFRLVHWEVFLHASPTGRMPETSDPPTQVEVNDIFESLRSVYPWWERIGFILKGVEHLEPRDSLTKTRN